MSSVKGKLFEFFVCKLLLFCGFQPITKDGLLIYDGPSGTMIQGLGQPHNADVLLAPPIQTPFYFPTRLLVECKCYDGPIGLPIIRNALGLREDINSFDIVTEDILKSRQSPKSSQKYYSIQRYVYQVAVASLSGFKSTAFPFAQAHRIPLISFSDSTLFDSIRSCISELMFYAQEDAQFEKELLLFLQKEQDTPHGDLFFRHKQKNVLSGFIEQILYFQRRITIGLLEDGTILFLIKSEPGDSTKEINQYSDGYSIHWSHQSKAWELHDRKQRYYFELPHEIYKQWKKSAGEQRRAALSIKRDYFSKIVLFGNNTERYDRSNGIITIYLSEQFMRDAERGLDES